MSLKTDLQGQIGDIFRTIWTERDGIVVPTDTSITLGNNAVKIDAVVLYADLADSTAMVNSLPPHIAAEIYKTFLYCAAKIIKSQGGEVTAYDGDRVMAVFLESEKNTNAIKAAMKIHAAVRNIVQPGFDKIYSAISSYKLKHVCGIDRSDLYVAKTGVRGANDLVWVGRAANYAAKLSALPETYQTYITKTVYDGMLDVAKFTNGQNMWWTITQTSVPIQVYGST
ncbi:adenylate/guanylate cyclase domain-containing protein [Caballeronia sp. GaOx3]|uniref:adenylate/guanylate cyclase domain-containing protein n=1 Tax=Caballeronia sp. GaOx3 TaxID=2921740 RepID=UPI002028D303|nr:adenylate/guanylate cyclase domain-containing protein [Caballeronia sp. GaOx3]